jgi:hypothetical protein
MAMVLAAHIDAVRRLVDQRPADGRLSECSRIAGRWTEDTRRSLYSVDAGAFVVSRYGGAEHRLA